jgi:hypothetical protein
MFDLLKFSISEEDQSFSLAKKALIFVEGTHKDSMGRQHEFPASRVKKFVDNTNSFIRSGGRLPFQKDHKKTQDFNIGDVEGELYTKVITESDLPNVKYRHLLGKVGVFVDNIVGKGREVCDQIAQGLIKTLSPGLDPMTESFIEVSATPTPAIIGPALFSKEGDEMDNLIYFEAMMPEAAEYKGSPSFKEKAFSFDELNSKKKSEEKIEEIYEELSEDLFSILYSIATASEEGLAAASINPVESSYDAIEYFLSNLENLFGLVGDDEEELENRIESPSVGKQQFPVGKTASDYERNSDDVLEFSKNKKVIGFTLQ